MTVLTDIILWTLVGVFGLSFLFEAIAYFMTESKYKRPITIVFFITMFSCLIVVLIYAILLL